MAVKQIFKRMVKVNRGVNVKPVLPTTSTSTIVPEETVEPLIEAKPVVEPVKVEAPEAQEEVFDEAVRPRNKRVKKSEKNDEQQTTYTGGDAQDGGNAEQNEQL